MAQLLQEIINFDFEYIVDYLWHCGRYLLCLKKNKKRIADMNDYKLLCILNISNYYLLTN